MKTFAIAALVAAWAGAASAADAPKKSQAKTPPKTQAAAPAKPAGQGRPTDSEVQLACIQGAVNVMVGSMQDKYWPDSKADEPKRRQFSAEAIALLNKSKQLNQDLGRFCNDLQVAAKKVAATR